MTDPVGKIQAIGKETVAKLKDLTAAATASSVPRDSDILQDFCVNHNSITTGASLSGLHHSTDHMTIQLSQKLQETC